MTNLDLSSIDPLRREEVTRRIDLLDAYIKLNSSRAEDAGRYAEEIGISVAQFYKLARVWRMHRDPKLVGAGRRGGKRIRRDGISQDVKRIVAEAVDEIGAEAGHEVIYREVVRRSRVAGVDAPSRGSVWTFVMNRRATSPTQDGPPGIIVGRLWPRLPTMRSSEVVFPEVVIAMRLPDRVILGIDVSTDPDRKPSAAVALAHAFDAMDAIDENLQVFVETGDVEDISAVHVAKLGHDPKPAKASVSRMLSESLGRVIGGMEFAHRKQNARVERLLRARSTNPLSRDAAVAEIERAVAAHNTTRAQVGKARPTRVPPKS